MTYPFLKGHGTENDFVLLPDLDGSVHGDLAQDRERVRALCDRRAGIGGDGVLRVLRSDARQDAEWFMDYRNSDGSVAEMCGNGIRLFVRYLVDAGLADSAGPIRVDTRDGVKVLTVDGDLITVDLGTPELLGETVVSVDRLELAATHVDMGNPHAVAFVDSPGRRGPAARGARPRRGRLPGRRQRRVRRTPGRSPCRDAGARAWLGRDPLLRDRRGRRDGRHRCRGFRATRDATSPTVSMCPAAR